MSEPIKGVLTDWFETGTEGVHWTLQDEKHISDEGFYSYEGLHILKNGDYLEISWKGSTPIWSGVLRMLKTRKAMFDPYLTQYVKGDPNLSFPQLSFAGLWVHALPINVDLGLWHDVFVARSGQYQGLLKKKPQ